MAEALHQIVARIQFDSPTCPTPLHIAAYNGETELVDFLVSMGAGIHVDATTCLSTVVLGGVLWLVTHSEMGSSECAEIAAEPSDDGA